MIEKKRFILKKTMSTLIQHSHEEIIDLLLNLETDKEEDKLVFINLLKMIRSLSNDVYILFLLWCF